MVGGVSPGKGGQEHLGLPVFDSVAEVYICCSHITSYFILHCLTPDGFTCQGESAATQCVNRSYLLKMTCFFTTGKASNKL